MDTPDRNQIGTPISRFEDSPVFNYINSLSPIKPVKSIHIAQTFNSLSFASLPSVFTSPHVSSHKESRFLRRHHFSDPSKPEFSSHNGNEGCTSARILDAVQLSDCSADPRESFEPGSSIIDATVELPNENSALAIELSRTLKYDCGSPDNNPMPHGIKTDPVSAMAGTQASLVRIVQEVSKERHCSFESELEIQGTGQIGQNKEESTGCDWESLISDAADLLIFDSSTNGETSKGQDQKLVDAGSSSFISLVLELPQDNIDDLQNTQPVDRCEELEMEDPATQQGEVGDLKEIDPMPDILYSTLLNKQVISNPSEEPDDKVENCIPFGCTPDSHQQRGMRRRCLVFEIAGAHRKNFEDDSNSSSSISSQSDEKIASDANKQLVPSKTGTGPSPRMLPGIGLHLNALATSSKDCRVVKHETLASGRQLISMPSPIASFHPLTSCQEPLSKSLALNSMEREMGPADGGVQVTQDASQASAFGVSEEFQHSSPRKKRHVPLLIFLAGRRRLEHAVESEACKRCNCKKSKCLKLYCECFAAGVYCVEPCSCQDCFNKPVHEDTVLATRKQIESRNPLAFAPKVIRSSDSVPETGDESNKTPASARHKRGCNCKKSSCLKKYCECFQGGVGCSINCRCEACKNVFGRKDGGPAPMGTEETEPEEEETETCDMNVVDISLQNSGVQKDEEHYPDRVLPVTPSFQICRTSVHIQFSSSSKPPRSSLPTLGSSPRLHTGQRLGKSDFLRPQSKFEKQFQMIPEDETPEILRGNCSPISGVKSASPNRKRVSPPHSEFGPSPGRRSSRKLILQSIPSFPSLTPHHETSDFADTL
ncbi:hypothetical protein HHK36_012680 [Tetracentron sinense]|uniref:CRC domain-containing protein n=1 Tax=Tetracentron sinense TaxID=13715 RepID=A0A835DIW9_TETSI|nr:hypothetical protein HHK36_012680 [Tetracentron sinense]